MSDEMNLEHEQPYGRRYVARPKICQFCADKSIEIDYKAADMLRRFVTEEGKIRPRRQTGTCPRHQARPSGFPATLCRQSRRRSLNLNITLRGMENSTLCPIIYSIF
jgi:small subunit ribosomal protein S18